MKPTLLFFCFCLLPSLQQCHRILVIMSTPFFSHHYVYGPLWGELLRRGHHLTLITTTPINDTTSTNLEQISLSFTYDFVFNKHQMQHIANTESNILVLMKHVLVMLNLMVEDQLQSPQMQEFIKRKDHYDLIILETTPAYFGFAAKYGCPVIVVTSMEATNHWSRIMGNLNNPVFTTHFNLPFGRDLGFFERLVSAIFEVFEEFITRALTYPLQQSIIRKELGIEDIDIWGIQKNVSMLFTHVVPGLSKATARIPSIVELNGMQVRPPKDLPADLQQFLDGATEGAIYFSLGSTVKAILTSQEVQQVFLDVIAELPYRVIWKVEGHLQEVPENLKVVHWAPQQDILRHKNVKLFMMQGGLQSIDEAIRFGVPMLVFPFYGDMISNSRKVEDRGLGRWLDWRTLNREVLRKAILETIGNETYLSNIEEIRGLMEEPAVSVDRAAWWVEFVLRHKGAGHLRSPMADIAFYQYYLLDIVLVLIIILVLSILMLKKITKCLMRTCITSEKFKQQ